MGLDWHKGVAYRYLYTELPPAMEWTLAAEDLGGSDDWDFNDVVFTFTDVIRNLKSANWLSSEAMLSGPYGAQSMRIITVTPKATGGTMPIYITYTGNNIKPLPDMPSGKENMNAPDENSVWFSKANADLNSYLNADTGDKGTFILGTEVHKWLGASSYTQFVNVGGIRQNVDAKSVQFVIPTNMELSDEKYFDYASSVSGSNAPLYGFGVIVDKDNKLNIDAFENDGPGFCHMPSLTMGEGTYLIGAPSDDKDVNVPQMILVQGDWQWPTERTNILDAYPNFKAWIGDHTNTDWIMNPTEGKVTKK